MKKLKMSTELMYVFGILFLAAGTVLMEKADFGMSMVVAPAYLFYLKLSASFDWFTFGMAEYMLQACLLIILSLCMRRFRLSYLFSFVTAVIYGFVLDGFMSIASAVIEPSMVLRVVFYVSGMILCSIGVACMFRTYVMPEAYELFVRELASKVRFGTGTVKTIYDCVSCLVAIILSFIFFGLWHFEGVKLGTIFCALINGWLITVIGKGLDKVFTYGDSLPLRSK